jgi:molecular chaperone HscB
MASVPPLPREAPADFDPDVDFFTVFGLPPTFEIDRDRVEQVYFGLAQAVHPDRFVGAAAGVRRLAMERSTTVNEAYRTLRDPVRRAEYLVRLGGIDLDSSDPTTGAPAMDQTFLIEMIERREAVAEARANGAAALDAYRDEVEDEIDDVMDDVEASLRRGDVAAAARALVVRRYLQRLVDELEAPSEDAAEG